MPGPVMGGPFDEGFHSYVLGLSRTRCPYPPGTPEHGIWSTGWAQAEAQDIDLDLDDGAESLELPERHPHSSDRQHRLG